MTLPEASRGRALPDEALKGHVGVAYQVLCVFKADGEADRARVDACRGEGAVVELAVGGRCDVRDHGVRAAERGGRGGQTQPGSEREPGLAAAVGSDRDDRAE